MFIAGILSIGLAVGGHRVNAGRKDSFGAPSKAPTHDLCQRPASRSLGCHRVRCHQHRQRDRRYRRLGTRDPRRRQVERAVRRNIAEFVDQLDAFAARRQIVTARAG
jgi:hypothetical protein